MKYIILLSLLLLLSACSTQNSTETTETSTAKLSSTNEIIDCGDDILCLNEHMLTCTPSFGVLEQGFVLSYNQIEGYEGNNCVIYTRHDEHPDPDFKDTEFTCKIPKEKIADMDTYLEKNMYTACTGSYVDAYKKRLESIA